MRDPFLCLFSCLLKPWPSQLMQQPKEQHKPDKQQYHSSYVDTQYSLFIYSNPVLEYKFLKKGLKELSFFYLPICISFPVPGRDSAHSSKCDDVKFMREFGQMVTHQVSYKSCFPCNTEGYKDLALNFKRINQVVY